MIARGVPLRSLVPTKSGQSIIVLTPSARVTASSGLPGCLGREDVAPGADVPLSALLHAEDWADLLAALRRAVSAPVGSTSGVGLVRPAGDVDGDTLRLTIHRLGADLLVGVLECPSEQADPAPPTVVRPAGSAVGDANGLLLARIDAAAGDLRVTAANAEFCTWFGRHVEEVVGQTPGSLFAPLAGPALLPRLERAVHEGEGVSDLAVLSRPDREPTVIEWQAVPVARIDEDACDVVFILRDASGGASSAASLGRGRRDVDAPTGLPNHVELLTRLERSIERAASPRTYRFALVGLELEGVHSIQDQLGNAASNMLIAATARRVKQTLRPSDMVARIGEGRLAILIDHFPEDEPLARLVERIERSVDGPFLIGGERLGLTAIHATSPTFSEGEEPASAGELMDALDQAVSRARPTP